MTKLPNDGFAVFVKSECETLCDGAAGFWMKSAARHSKR